MGAQLKRATNIATILSEEGLGFIAARLGIGKGDEDLSKDEQKQLPARIRRLCERLGPTFIKFGQVMSTRRDLLPEEFCQELSKLQAGVKPFNTNEALKIVETELCRPLKEVFRRVDDFPLAAASIAQVYGAELLDGQKVVIKVRRPDAADEVNSDLELLLWLSQKMHRFIPQYKSQRIHKVVEEYAHEARKELDFTNELNAAVRFKKYLENDPVICVPEVFREYSTSSIIVLERFEGHRLDHVKNAAALEALGMGPSTLVEALLRSVMEQAFIFGLIHADLHPGNIFILENGKIGIIDFGMHGEFPSELQSSMSRLIAHRANGRHEETVETLLEIYSHDQASDIDGFRRDIIAMSKEISNSTVTEFSIGSSLALEGKIAAKHGLVAPQGVLIFGRALIVTEGIALKFLPHAKIVEMLQPIMQRIFLKRLSVDSILGNFSSLLPEVIQHLENMPKVARRLMAIDRKIANGSASNLAELMGLKESARESQSSRPISGFGPWFVTGILWVSGVATTILPSPDGVVLFGGVSWISIATLFCAAILTGILFIKNLK